MPTHTIIERLKEDLLAARKSRDLLKVEALQSTLARITNSEAIAVSDSQSTYHLNIGVGSSEAARRVLSVADVLQIVHDEIDELQSAVTSMGAHADDQYAINLRQKIQILKSYIP